MSGLLELAERCEKAKGPDRELDLDIMLGFGDRVLEKRGRDQRAWLYPVAGNEPRLDPSPFSYGYNRLPRYTASLDAAMTLVPEGWGWSVSGSGFAELLNPLPPGRSKPTTRIARAATPALALCAAALRARAAQSNRGLSPCDMYQGTFEWQLYI